MVGVARRDLSASFATEMREGILKGGGVSDDESKTGSVNQSSEIFRD